MIGQKISHYKILDKLGQGGMGEVYKAWDTQLEREVALKFLFPRLTGNAANRARFVREARAAASLNHPNIVTVHEIAQEAEQHYIVMEYLEGRTLNQVMAAGRLSIEKILVLLKQICVAVGRAHSQGIVHRDIKPQNIMVDSENRIKVLDFGLAKIRKAEAITTESSTLGTLFYMSPEQFSGMEVDQRTDIWSIGVVLYQMLTGRLPFKGEYPQQVGYAILNEDPAAVADLREDCPRQLERIVADALKKSPQDRTASVAAILQALNGIALKNGDSATAVIETGVARPSIAVMPFRDMSPSGDQDYFCEGIAEEIINALTHIHGLRVIARTSAFAFKGTLDDVRQIGRKLDVNTLLEGSVRKSGSRLRITAQLINTQDGSHLWSERYDRDMEDLFQIQDDVSMQIVRSLEIKLDPARKSLMSRKYTADIHLHDLMLQGRYHWSRFTESGFTAAIESFQAALELEPSFGPALAGIALCYTLMGYYRHMETEQAFQEAESFALRSLDSDERLMEAHLALGWVRMSRDWDWHGSEASFRRAIDLNPGNYFGHLFYSVLLSIVGRHKEAIEEARHAEAADPLMPLNSAILGLRHYYNRDYRRSIEILRGLLAKSPDFAPVHWMIALPLGAAEDYEAAVEAAEKSRDLAPPDSPLPLSILGIAYALHPRHRADALQVAAKLQAISATREISAFFVGMIHSCLGESEAACDWFERAEREKDSMLMWLKADPLVNDRMSGHPRYAAMLEKMGLTPGG